MTLRRLRPNWVRHEEEDWEVRIVDRTTVRYVEGGHATEIPVEMGLRGQQAVVHLEPTEVGGVVALKRVRAALDFLDVAVVLDGDHPRPGENA